ncbi:MAG: asparagine synthase-related protein, partial [Desulfobacterales bacterium]|nr:asparagine synthase-related protein [Desulfobacterales bacterium]
GGTCPGVEEKVVFHEIRNGEGVTMPGIVGMISGLPPDRCRRMLSAMIGTMLHEPFYRSGLYANEELGVYAGWVCHEGSFSDCMPVANEEKNVFMVVSGENFADRSELRVLKSRGHEFNGEDATSLVHLYEEDPDDFFRELNGLLSGVIVDLRENRVTLFNDRFGSHRLYYHENQEGFLFSSEAKSLLSVCPELREIDPAALGEYFSCGCVLENRSLFKNLKILPGGSAWTCLRSGGWERKQYFTPEEWENSEPLEGGEFCEQLKENLTRVIPRYLQGKQPVAISLTGGLDSRLIMAFVDGKSARLPCFTFGSENRDSLDVTISRQVARACSQEHTVLRLGGEFLSRFPEEALRTVYISEGGLSGCGSYEHYLNAKAREIAPVRLTGNWGSELLRGARAFKAYLPYRETFNPDFYKHIEKATGTFARIGKVPNLTFSLFRQAPWQGFGRLAVEQSQLTQRTPYMDKDFAELVYRARREDLSSDRVSLQVIGEAKPGLLEIRTDRGAAGKSGPAFSWLHRAFHETAFRMEYYCGHGMPRWLSRWDKALKRLHYERLILGRYKFHQFRRWFQGELAGYLREMVLDKRTLGRPFLNPKRLEGMVHKHIRGDENYLNELDKILSVELVHRLFVDEFVNLNERARGGSRPIEERL